MGGTARRIRPGENPAVTASPRLLGLIERDELDWDDERHREAYLRAWVNGAFALPARPVKEADA
jgi:hypothetical protein